MKLVVGLGNPGPRYEATRHNVGARVVERLAARQRIALVALPFAGAGPAGRFGAGSVGGRPIGLLLPGTWMNDSGSAVAAARAGLPVDEIWVAYDDVDLPFARLRVRAGGSSGGHRGLADILTHLGGEDVPRLRFGVGRPPLQESVPLQKTTDWVLQPFTAPEERVLRGALDRAAEALECGIVQGVAEAMNRFNAAGPEAE